ncbi:MAG TPA: hypothetical protein VJG83_02000 [archaeon]|nr:hypothetical protein [archaeon]
MNRKTRLPLSKIIKNAKTKAQTYALNILGNDMLKSKDATHEIIIKRVTDIAIKHATEMELGKLKATKTLRGKVLHIVREIWEIEFYLTYGSPNNEVLKRSVEQKNYELEKIMLDNFDPETTLRFLLKLNKAKVAAIHATRPTKNYFEK